MFNLGSTWTCFWRVGLRYKEHREETLQERRARLEEERRKLKEAGFNQTEWLFKFRNTDPKEIKDQQKELAKKQAAEITRKSDVILEIVEGSYL